MPRDCVAEIESAAPLDTPNVLKMHRASDPARTKVRGNDDDFAFPRWKREHTRRFAFLEHDESRVCSLIRTISDAPLMHVVRITILLFGPLRGHRRYKR